MLQPLFDFTLLIFTGSKPVQRSNRQSKKRAIDLLSDQNYYEWREVSIAIDIFSTLNQKPVSLNTRPRPALYTRLLY